MLPEKHHMVYMPVAGLSRGGHSFSLDTMHLTELSRSVDSEAGKYITNDSHLGTLETLCRLVIFLTVLPKWRSESYLFFWSNPLNNVIELYKCSLVALWGMVIHHEAYVTQDADVQQSMMLPMAKNIANAVLDMFGLGSCEGYFAFLGKVFDRGEEVEVHDFLQLFNCT